jgi:hypothetical protein
MPEIHTRDVREANGVFVLSIGDVPIARVSKEKIDALITEGIVSEIVSLH